jgi:hypothetical protein
MRSVSLARSSRLQARLQFLPRAACLRIGASRGIAANRAYTRSIGAISACKRAVGAVETEL